MNTSQEKTDSRYTRFIDIFKKITEINEFLSDAEKKKNQEEILVKQGERKKYTLEIIELLKEYDIHTVYKK